MDSEREWERESGREKEWENERMREEEEKKKEGFKEEKNLRFSLITVIEATSYSQISRYYFFMYVT